MSLSTAESEFLATYIVESDAIERIVRTKEGVLEQIKAYYPEGHVGAYGMLTSFGGLLTGKLIREVQALITSEQGVYGVRELPRKWVGKWRDIGVSVGGRSCPHYATIPESMRKLIMQTQKWQKGDCIKMSREENIRFIARMHYDYLRIHPFADGNGRSSRAITYFLFRYARIPPILFEAHNRYETYYQCFEDPSDMERYFLTRS